MVRWLILLCCCALAACAGVAPPAPDRHLFHDEAFAAPSRPIDANEVFALSPAMRRLLDSRPQNRHDDPREQLLGLLFGPGHLKLEYDSSVTRNAAEAFAAQRGNCLSLVIMTAAFAKAVGLQVDYRQGLLDETWERNGQLIFGSGHVNLALSRTLARNSHVVGSKDSTVVDFLPADEIRGLRTRSIGEHTVLAMYMNNRAAEALARGAIDTSYWWARQALVQDPSFRSAYNTLGVIYSNKGRPAWALAVFEAVLAQAPDDTTVIGNLVAALHAAGRDDEARPWADKLARLEPFPPLYFLRAGQADARRDDWGGARELFRKEARRQPYNAEVQFWLAQANYRLGNWREADEHLELARQNSSNPQDHALYAAKLGWLRAHAAGHPPDAD